MKTLIKIASAASLAAGSLLLSVPAQATEFVAADNTPATQVCMAIASNKPLTLRNELADTHVTRYAAAKVLNCNDMSVGKFAAVYGFNRTAKMLGVDQEASVSIHDIAMLQRSEPLVISGSK